MGCLQGVGAGMLVFMLVMGQIVAVHGGRPGICFLQPIPKLYASAGHGTRKLSEGFKEIMFRRPWPPLRPPPRSQGYDHLVGWELRKAPSGPDPLHHHNGGPRKPQTP